MAERDGGVVGVEMVANADSAPTNLELGLSLAK